MKLGIGSYTYAWAVGVPGYEKPAKPLTVFDLLDRAIGAGLSVVQVCDNLPLTALTDADLSTLASKARDARVRIEVGTRGIGEDNLLTHLALAERFGSPILRVVIDAPGDEPSTMEVIERLTPLVGAFEEKGVGLALENHDRFSSQDLASIVEVLDPDVVGICLDTVNSFGALEGPQVVLDTLAQYAFSLHIKDFTIRRADHNMGFVIDGCPAGKGRLDIPSLMMQLPPHISAILELWTPPAATMAETIVKEAAWADESLDYLKPLLT